jgi:hypothetical protein
MSFFAARKEFPYEDSFPLQVLEFEIWNLCCGSAALEH